MRIASFNRKFRMIELPKNVITHLNALLYLSITKFHKLVKMLFWCTVFLSGS